MTDPNEMLELFVTGQVRDWDVITWARDLQTQLKPKLDLNVDELATFEPTPFVNTRKEIVRILVAMSPGADEFTPDQIVLKHQAKQLIAKEITPIAFCATVRKTDADVIQRCLNDPSLIHPSWLHDLWNACDWCDEHWTLDSQVGLKEAATSFASNSPASRT